IAVSAIILIGLIWFIKTPKHTAGNANLNTNAHILPPKAKNNNDTSSFLTVYFQDAVDQKKITNTKVTLYSDNGMRCIKAPCPTNGRSWDSTTDKNGRVSVPIGMGGASMTFTLDGYEPVEMHEGTYISQSTWLVEATKKS